VFLIGCVGIIVIGTIASVALFYYGKKIVTEKVHKIENIGGGEESDYGKKAAKLKEAHPFTAPADGVITEDQLNRFLSVRKAVYAVYKQHEPEIQSVQKGPGSVSDVWKGMEFVNDLRMAQINELVNQEMSPDEYKFIAVMVYTGWIGKMAKEGLKGEKSYEDAANKAIQKQIDDLDKQLQDPNTSEETKKQLQPLRDTLESQKKVLTPELKELDEGLQKIPQQNMDLFAKHKEDIEKYSMGGLDMLGLV
jgi:hypothetical protein